MRVLQLIAALVCSGCAFTAQASGIIPQIVSGHGWSTAITIHHAAPYYGKSGIRLRFYDSGGRPAAPRVAIDGNAVITYVEGATVTPQGLTVGGETRTVTSLRGANQPLTREDFTVSVPEMQSVSVRLSPDDPFQGYARVDRASAVWVSATLSYAFGGYTSEMRVPLQASEAGFQSFIFDNAGASQTAIALVNMDFARSLRAAVLIYDENGVLISNSSATLCPGCQDTFLLRERFPETATARGIVHFRRDPSPATSATFGAISLLAAPTSGAWFASGVLLPTLQ